MSNRIGQFDSIEMHRVTLPLSDKHPVYVAYTLPLSKQARPAFNMHYAPELGIVLSGRIKRYYRHWRTELTAGQVWLCGIWEPHGFQALQPNSQMVILSILPEMLATTQFPGSQSFDWIAPFTVPPQKRPSVDADRRATFLSLGQRIVDTIKRKEPARDILLCLLFFEIIIELCARWSFPAKDRSGANDNCMTVNKAIQMVFNSRRLITLQEIAKTCGMSASVFAGLFRRSMGISFADFSLRYRLDGAKKELGHSQHPIKMISASWGFTDKSHFHHVFVQHYGCTPAEFRKKYAAAPIPR